MREQRVGFLLYEFPSPTQTFVADQVELLLGQGVDVRVFVRRLPFTVERTGVLHEVYDRIAWRDRTIDLGREDRWSRPEQGMRLVARLAAAFVRSPRATLRLVRRAFAREARLTQRLAALLRAAPFAGRGLALLHVHFTWSGWNWSDLGALLELPVVTTVYGADVSLAGVEGERLNAELFAASDAVVCISAHLAALVSGQGAKPDRTLMIHPTIDCEFFSPAGTARTDPPIVLTVARLHWKKGHAEGLRAIAALRRRGVELRWRLLGAGAEEPALRAAVADLGLADCVEFAGNLERSAVRDAMREATLVLSPSVREELGVALAEAQACGVPVVSTRVGGVAEIVEDGSSGLLVPPRDAAAIADAIETLLGDGERRAAMGVRGRMRVRERFSGAAADGALASLYRRVIKERERTPAARTREAPQWT